MYLYRGFTPTIMGVIPYKGLGFLTYEKLKAKSKEYNIHLSPPLRLACGAFAGLCGNLIAYPFEIVRRRMQTPQHMKPHGRLYNSIFASLVYIMWTEGVRNGLYKGITMNLFKNPIATGLSFTINDYCKSFCYSATMESCSKIMLIQIMVIISPPWLILKVFHWRQADTACKANNPVRNETSSEY